MTLKEKIIKETQDINNLIVDGTNEYYKDIPATLGCVLGMVMALEDVTKKSKNEVLVQTIGLLKTVTGGIAMDHINEDEEDE